MGAARGVPCSGTLLAGDGVRLRTGSSAVEVTDTEVGLAADATVAVVVRAELWAKCEYVEPVSDSSKLDRGLPAAVGCLL